MNCAGHCYFFSVVAGVLAAITVTGCGETKQDVIVRNRQAAEGMRAKLISIADKLPPKGTLRDRLIPKNLTPPLFYDGPGDRGNTEIVMEEQLRDPEVKPEFDLRLSRNLLRCLAWAGPHSPLAESARNSAAGTIEQEFQQALNWEYLVVVRVVDFVPPQLLAESQFTGGEITLAVYLLRASDEELLGEFPVEARSAGSVDFSYKPTDSRTERAEAFVHSSVWQDARQKVASGLREITGGDVRIGD